MHMGRRVLIETRQTGAAVSLCVLLPDHLRRDFLLPLLLSWFLPFLDFLFPFPSLTRLCCSARCPLLNPVLSQTQ